LGAGTAQRCDLKEGRRLRYFAAGDEGRATVPRWGAVFASEIGTPLEPSNIDRRSFKPLLEKAGLPDIRFHDLRHTCATVLLSQG
jgi:integrase